MTDRAHAIPKTSRRPVRHDNKKPGVAFWATVVLAVVVAYPLSIGPAFAIQPSFPDIPIYEAYGPVLIGHQDRPIHDWQYHRYNRGRACFCGCGGADKSTGAMSFRGNHG
jgi:hypothetical protein